MDSMMRVVYFSSVSENTKRFVDKLGVAADRIPLLPTEDFLTVDYPYVLVTPTYGAGKIRGSIPKQVVKFLNHEPNRNLCQGVICGGNLTFGEGAFSAGWLIAQKIGVPVIYNFEVLGTREDVASVQEKLRELSASFAGV